MEWYWLLTMMVFCHIIDDFHIQGILADLKQKSWWCEQIAKISEERPDAEVPKLMQRYGKDYIAALLAHAFEWSFFVHIPLMIFVGFEPVVLASLFANIVIHALVDDLKCNVQEINLVQDQIYHLGQICISFAIIYGVLGL